MERRLAAILSYDVVGYSRAMGADESGTLERLKAHRRETIDPKAAEHGGRTIKLMGDGGLMEFASVVDAVAFAVEMQFALAERDKELPEDRRLLYRIGINVGDVIVDGDDIYGDGVNVAARLEGLAESGGICVRRNVRNQVRGKLDLDFKDLGEVEVKNIARPVRVFHIVMNEKATALAAAPVDALPMLENNVGEVDGAAQIAPTVHEKPSIAVLPFDNMSGDQEQEYFADGITEDIITTFSKVPGLFVIARNSTFTYRGTAKNVKQIADELDVRFIVEGSVRKAGNRVRITAQLIDATTGHHQWAERYDRDLSDIFALQDEITREIVTAVDAELTEGEQIRVWREAASDPAAYEHFSRGRDYFSRSTRKTLAQARVELEKALALNPVFAAAYAYLGWTHAVDAWFRLSEDPEASCRAAREATERALALDNSQPDALGLKAYVHILSGEYEQAVDSIERAVRKNPNSADVHNVLAIVRNYSGNPELALVASRHAVKLSPRMSYCLLELSHALWLLERCEEALTPLRRLLADRPYWQSARALLIVTLVGLGRINEAREQAEEMLRINPRFSVSEWTEMHPYKRSTDRSRYVKALQRVSLPE